MLKKWIINSEINESLETELVNLLNIDKILARLLIQRGISDFESAKRWFRPDLANLHDPFLMKDMDKAVERLTDAISTGEKILIYGDYDVDGTTAVSLLILFLKKYSKYIDYYIPDRYKEGYGISKQGIDFAKQYGFTLIIALDCGIKANDEIGYAQSSGIDVIVCDHHNEGLTLPQAFAVLNPKRIDCIYPCKDLSGCGVGFKLLQGFCVKNKIDLAELFEYIDLVAVSIASDIVKIVDENRILTYFGLRKINSNPVLGISAIKQIAQMHNDIDISDIVFKIGPRINAAGRIQSGRLAVELLTCSDSDLVKQVVYEIDKNNNHRKDLDKATTSEALMMLSIEPEHDKKNTNTVFSPSWHKGVVGIVASRITEVYYRPTIVLTESEGIITGSARSIDGFDLYSALEKCSCLLEHFGGHMYAAGLTMKKENYEIFKSTFESVVSSMIDPEMLIPKLKIDAELPLGSINPKFYRILKQFEPFGPGNMTPVFLAKNIQPIQSVRTIGTDNSHLKITFQHNGDMGVLDSVGFGLGKYVDNIKTEPFDVCYSIDENEFRGEKNIQLKIRDIKLKREKEV